MSLGWGWFSAPGYQISQRIHSHGTTCSPRRRRSRDVPLLPVRATEAKTRLRRCIVHSVPLFFPISIHVSMFQLAILPNFPIHELQTLCADGVECRTSKVSHAESQSLGLSVSRYYGALEVWVWKKGRDRERRGCGPSRSDAATPASPASRLRLVARDDGTMWGVMQVIEG